MQSSGMLGAGGAGAGGPPNEHEVAVRLQSFIHLNNLDESCQGWLRGLSAAQQKAVMDQGMTIHVDPSRGSANSVVMGRIKKAKQGTLGPPPAGQNANVNAMAVMNPMMAMMAQMAQMAQAGGMGGTGSAVAMGRVKKVKSAEVQQELMYYPHTNAMIK